MKTNKIISVSVICAFLVMTLGMSVSAAVYR